MAIVVHQYRDEALDLARFTVAWLEAGGHAVRLAKDDAKSIDRAELARNDDELAIGADLAVSVGGDGTMLRAVELAADHDVPVLGVHAGNLGYLTEVEANGASAALGRFLVGDYDIEERLRVAVALERTGRPAGPPRAALNEAVVEKTPSGHTVRLAVHLDGEYFTTYAADALIVATPTGSTAYALSARGPIVAPRHRALLLTPVSPHMLFDRTLVLLAETEIRIVVASYRPASLFIDGARLDDELAEGDAVVCRAAAKPARLVTFGERRFHSILKAKFGLNDR
ncbi:MAG: NAD(+)/NADH kinase [Acidimicrobiales bacterium]